MRQAGFFTGLVLLVVLCAVTDWTIRLIVLNAKLSGQTSYIGIMNHCFGSSGRAAVSFFQFAFAFGGMQRSTSLPACTEFTSETYRHVRIRNHHRLVHASQNQSKHTQYGTQAIQYPTSYGLYSPIYTRCRCCPYSRSANSSSRSAPSASHTRSPFTATSTNSHERLVWHSSA